MYIWVDLRRLLFPKSSRSNMDYSVLRASDDSAYSRREREIANICIRHGVQISLGSTYATEEYGWFRITFTVQRDALEEGLRRLSKSLDEIEAMEWK